MFPVVPPSGQMSTCSLHKKYSTLWQHKNVNIGWFSKNQRRDYIQYRWPWHSCYHRDKIYDCNGILLKTRSERYWSSFSRSPMFSRFSISFLMPLIQDCASSADSATRSRLPLRPRKTSVKHRSAGNSSAMLSSTSDWWPSRIASTSLTETGHKDGDRMENWALKKKQSVINHEARWATVWSPSGDHHKINNNEISKNSITLFWRRLR